MIPRAVEELLRFDGPVQYIERLCVKDFELHGVSIPAQHTVRLCIGAANRDPRAYDHPDRLDLTRTITRPVVFGLGPHFCLGAALARLEARVFFTTLVQRYPNLALVPGQILEWGEGHRGLKALHVDWGEASGVRVSPNS